MIWGRIRPGSGRVLEIVFYFDRKYSWGWPFGLYLSLILGGPAGGRPDPWRGVGGGNFPLPSGGGSGVTFSEGNL